MDWVRRIRRSSEEEYCQWYLAREGRKSGHTTSIVDPVAQLRHLHEGKTRHWFGPSTRWSVVELDTVADLDTLVFLNCDWTRNAGLVIPGTPDYRVLRTVAANALRVNYLSSTGADRHRQYYQQLKSGQLRLREDERLAICSAEASELAENPSAKYYLLDGVGRGLPYAMLVRQGYLSFAPVEAFVAER